MAMGVAHFEGMHCNTIYGSDRGHLQLLHISSTSRKKTIESHGTGLFVRCLVNELYCGCCDMLSMFMDEKRQVTYPVCEVPETDFYMMTSTDQSALGIGYLAIGQPSAGYWLAIGYLLAGYQLAIDRLWAGYQLSIGWPWAGYRLAIHYLSAGYGLAMGWLFTYQTGQ